jgi:hypothetical protein
MENKKQTAVEWLKLQLEEYGDPQYCELTWEELDELCEQAKEMEKQQIIKAFNKGAMQPQRMGTDYFDETYKNNVWEL